jgi:hypothetical protein
MDVAWPGWRMDVLSALDVLAAEPPRELLDGRWDPRQPNVAAAVACLVDDTAWVVADASDAIGRVLRDEQETWLLRPVVAAVAAVASSVRVVATDAAWFADRGWPEVRRRAAAALNLLRVNDGVRG